MTLAHTDSDGVYTTPTPGETARDVSAPTLVIIWTASDSIDPSHYSAGWTLEQVGQVGNLSYTIPQQYEWTSLGLRNR